MVMQSNVCIVNFFSSNDQYSDGLIICKLNVLVYSMH